MGWWCYVDVLGMLGNWLALPKQKFEAVCVKA